MMEEELQIVPAAAMMAYKEEDHVEAQFVEMMVPLYSYGCAKKIKKALSRFKGIYSVNVDYKHQKVTVWGICNKKEVLSTIRAKRKGACFWNQQRDHQDTTNSINVDDNVPSLCTTTPSSSPATLSRRASYSYSLCKSPLKIIIKGQHTLNWKTVWKKVFNRSNSF